MSQITDHYPKANSIQSLKEQIKSELEQNGFELSKTIWGTSVCSDEINNSFDSISSLFAVPGPFRFGGISGYPFTGKTGIGAFASHIPNDGGAFILYGPHIGISSEGELGLMHREGQISNSSSCGSLIAGLNAIKNDISFDTHSYDDYQQERVVNTLHKFKKETLNSENPIKTATDKMYESIHSDFKNMINESSSALAGFKICLMGGILINTDWDKEDFFEIRNVEFLEF